VTEAGWVDLQVTATDDVAVARVEFYIDGDTTPFVIDDAPPFSAAWLMSSANDGDHTFTATAFDAEDLSDSADAAVTVAMSDAGGVEVDSTLNPAGSWTQYNAVAVGPDGSIYVVGRVDEGTSADAWFGKFSPDGQTQLWGGGAGLIYNGIDNSFDNATAVALDGQGNVAVAGTERAGGEDDVFVRRFTESGAELWTGHYEGNSAVSDDLNDMIYLPDGRLMLAGRQRVGATVDDDAAWISVVNDNSGEDWHITDNDGGAADIDAVALTLDDDGNAVLVGTYFHIATNEASAWVVKYTPDGDRLWQRTQSGPGGLDAEALDVAPLPAGGVITTGYVESGTSQVWLREYDGDGIPGTEYNYDPTGLPAGLEAEAFTIAVDPAGYILLGGNACCANDIFLQRLSPTGEELWTTVLEAGQFSTTSSVASGPNGEAVLVGYWAQGGGVNSTYLGIFAP
jgi:hypothetical protein